MRSGIIMVLLVGGFASAALAECTCTANKAKGGWCGDCKKGYVAGVEMQSETLYKAVAGTKADAAELKCDACKEALTKDGFCEKCNVGYVKGMAYPKYAYYLAKGEVVDPATITCEKCKKNAADHGWCDTCKAGMVGNLKFTDKEAYEQAVKAVRVTKRAAALAAKCDGCALAMVSDGTCEKCKLTYKNGKKVTTEKEAPGEPAAKPAPEKP